MKSQDKQKVSKKALKQMVNPENSRKVFVGLSGGVDSAVSAALLKKQGFDVSGVFIKAWTPDWMECTWKEDRRSAMRAAAMLDIPFYTLDLEKEYKEEVVDYMVSEYRAGRTPNPDVMCNKEIKFGAFLKWARAKGADYVATGHYAQNDFNKGLQILCEAKDKNKDQSYFLWTLDQSQLKHILFPVGGLLKPQVRVLAGKFGLPQETRKDSQGLCFLGQVDMREFLSHYIEPKRGNVLNMAGKVIGTHEGALFFTAGERHGYTINIKTNNDEPLYVIEKDVEKNTITVGPKKSLSHINNKKEILVVNVNWISGSVPLKKEMEFRFRYRHEKLKCKIKTEDGKVIIETKDLLELPASGQSVVFYDGEVCLGGGVIL